MSRTFPLRVMVVTIASYLALGCSPHSTATTTLAARVATTTDSSRPSPPEPSIYPLHVALHDQDGRAIGVDAYRGHPVLVSMFYGSCPVACPLIVSNVKRVESELGPDDRARVRVLLVSFDPEHDTPAALRAVAKKRDLDLDRWTLATGPDDDVRQLAAALGVSYRKLPEGGFAHTSVIAALDASGQVVARADGPDADLSAVVHAVARTSR